MKKLKLNIIKNCKLQLKLGLNIGSEGNISIRRGNKIFITPSGVDIKDLKSNSISELNLDGKNSNKIKPSSEVDLHLMIYKKRKGINAIVHCHSDWATILSCTRRNIPSFHYMVAEFGGENIKCSKYATFGTRKLANFVYEASIGRKGCLIANHGQICFGENIEEAMHLSIALEKLSKHYYFCLLSQKLEKLSKVEITEVLKKFSSYKSKH